MKKHKKGIEISHWKIEGTDAFASIDPVWTDEELDIGPTKEDYSDDEQEKMDAQIQEQMDKPIL
jgi:hypothetical protein